MGSEIVYLPANFTDAGKLMGAFEIRNAVEAAVLGVPVLFLCAYFLPFAITTKIIVTLTIFVPVAGFALIGLNDDSLTRYLGTWVRWLRRRTALAYRGEVDQHEFKRAYLRWRRQGR